MPRIPKGNFDVAPSMNVQATKVPEIEAFGTQTARAMGKQALNIGKQWSKAQAKVEALGGVSSAEQEVMQLEDRVKGLADSADGGVIPSARAGEKGMALSDAVAKEIETVRQSHLANMADNPEQMEMYNQIIAPRLQTLQNKVIREQVVQQKKKVGGALEDKMQAIQMKSMMGDDYSEDIHAFNVMADKAIGVYSQKEVAEMSSKLNKTLAFSLPKSLEYKGWSKEREAQVKRSIAGLNLTEGERLAAEFNLNQAIETGKSVTRRKVNKEFNQFIADAKDIPSYLLNRDNARNMFTTISDLGPAEWETQEEYNKKLDTLASTIISNEVAIKHSGILHGSPQEISTEVETAAGVGVETRMESIDEAEARKNQELFKDAMDIKNKLLGSTRGIASNTVDQAIAEKINGMKKSMKSKGGALKVFTQFDPMYAQDMNSGDPDRRDAAITRMMEFNKKNQVGAHNATLVTLDEADAYGKELKRLKSGDADPTGMHQLNLIKQVKEKYGAEWAGKAIEDIITFGGGTKSGKTNVPATWAMVNYIDDDTLSKEILSAQNRMDENKAGMLESKQYKELDNAIRNNTVLPKLRHGQLSDNDQLANGFTESVKALALSYMVGPSGLDADDAVEKAQDRIFSSTTFYNNGDNVNLMIPKKSLADAGYDEDDLADATNNMMNFNALKTIAPKIAWDKMGGRGSSRLARIMQDINSKDTDEEKYARAQELLGDSMMIVNDGKNRNNVSMYIKTADSPPIPVIVESETGYRAMNIDMVEAIGKSKEYEVAEDARSTFGEFFQGVADTIAIDEKTLNKKRDPLAMPPIGQTPRAMEASRKTLKALDETFIGDIEGALKEEAVKLYEARPIGQERDVDIGPLDYLTEVLSGRKMPRKKKKK